MKYMFDSFEEYAEIMKIDKSSREYLAYEIIWNMARTKTSMEFSDEKRI